MRKLRFTNNRFKEGNVFNCRFLGVLFAFLLTATISNTTFAQCAMTCNDDVNVSLPGPAFGCEITVTPQMVLEDPDQCAGPYVITIMTLTGTVIPGSPTITSDYIGQTLMYSVVDQSSNNSCWGQMDIEDKLGPTIDCSAQTVYCVENTDPDLGIMPLIEDCSGDMTTLSISHFDSVLDGGCTEDYSALISRTWTATDPFGNTSTCVQPITVERVSLLDFTPTCPANANMNCTAAAAADTSPQNTGYPYFTINGVEYPIVPGADNYCQIASSYSDEVFDLCGGGQKILRTWTVYDWCISTDLSANPFSCIQVIRIEDTEPPVIVCPANFTQGSVAGGCLTTIIIPQPISITDGCSDVEVFVITPAGIKNVGAPLNLGEGVHPLTYVATDNCGNSSSCVMNVTVIDDTAPIAVCDEFTIVALSGDGNALIAAEVFDDGSSDNCGLAYFEARRMVAGCNDEGIFDEYVNFCCEDLSANVMVVFRVYDAGGNYNECMVEVAVQDKIDPTILCPPDKLVECEGNTINTADLSAEGLAVGQDNCDVVTVTEVVEDNRTSCGVGEILRTFTATDGGGRTSSCVQTLSVENSNPFDISTVIYPVDYETTECGALVEPENLPINPSNYREPLFSSNSCDLIAVTHEDTYLPINPPACFKILRKWIVIDWCQYNPNAPIPLGYGEWTQVIKVTDAEAPVFACPDSLVITSTEADCNNANVAYAPFTATDCSNNINFSYEIDLGQDGTTDIYANGNDISGTYPMGNHTVTISASDGCGNVGVCSFPLLISDGKKPSPICVNGVAIELMPMGDGGIIEVSPNTLNYGSTDNCTAQEDLILELSPSVFDCSDVGTNVVILSVTDEAGNTDYCETYIIIQDNMNLCTPGLGGAQIIAGAVSSETGYAMSGVNVNISGNGPTSAPIVTDENGQYEFAQLQAGYDYTVQPDMNQDWLNGVTTYDLVIIKRHILGTTALDSPYKMIAADVNKSSSVTTSDIVSLRRVILGVDEVFPNDNHSYRFVDENYTFTNMNNPWEMGFPEVYNINNLELDMLGADFMAIKVGDVNGTAIFNINQAPEERSSDAMNININDRQIREGDLVTVPVLANDMKNVFGFQFALDFDINALQFVEMNTNEISNMTEANFGMKNIDNGTLLVSWDNAENTQHNTNTLFTLTFRAISTTTLSNSILINPTALKAEAYKAGATDEVLNIELDFNTNELANDFELFQNQPNPFNDLTTIRFSLPQASQATITVFDLDGKVLTRIEKAFEKGLNAVDINQSELGATGVMLYQLETATQVATRKMVVVK